MSYTIVPMGGLDTVPFHITNDEGLVVAKAYSLRDGQRMVRALNKGTADPRLLLQEHPSVVEVIDHEAEGDGSDNPTWCWCGRGFAAHLRRPRD